MYNVFIFFLTGSFIDTNPTLNFIVYVPTDKEYPLFILDEKCKSATNYLGLNNAQPQKS